MAENNEPKWEDTEPLFEETSPIEASNDVPSFDDTVPVEQAMSIPSEETTLPELLKTGLGTGVGSAAGYGAGSLLGAPIENIANKAIAADMGVSSKFIKEFGQEKANELAKTARKEGIYSLFSSPESQLKKAEAASKLTGSEQAALYERVAPNAQKTSISEIIEDFSKKAPDTSLDTSKVKAYETLLDDLKNYKDYKSGLKIKGLGLEGLQNLKRELTDIAYKEGKALTPESTAKTAMAGDAASSVRSTIDKRIEEVDKLIPGSKEASLLKEINKKYGQLSSIEEALVSEASKQGAKADDIVQLLKRGTSDVAKRGLFKGAASVASKLPVVGALIGGTLGAATGALASEDKSQGAAKGFVEGIGDAILGPIAPEKIADATMLNTPERKKLLEDYRKKQVEGGVSYVKNIQKQEPKEQYLTKARDVVQIDDMGINDLYSKVQASGSSAAKAYSGPLEKALNSEPQRRSTIMYGLQQQPAFRQLLKDLEDNSEE